MLRIEYKVLDPRITPEMLGHATHGAAAVDLRACYINGIQIDQPQAIHPFEKFQIGSGIAVHIGGAPICYDWTKEEREEGLTFAGLLIPRSGLGSKHGIVLRNTVGLIDADYQGEIIMALENRSTESFMLEPLMRIAQFMVIPVVRPQYCRVDEFTVTTDRGTGGFGSTGRG